MQTSFIPYITLNDYLPSIQSGQLNLQILDAIERGGRQQRMFAESWAIGKIKATLEEYFDIEHEITDTLPFKYNKKYYAGERCIIDFPEWIASSGSEDESDANQIIYNAGNCVVKYKDEENKLFGIGYMCKTQNSDTTWNEDNWIAIGNQYDIYYISFPYPKFHLDVEESRGTIAKGFYMLNDIVCYKNHTWQCKMQTIIYSHSTVEQYVRSSNIPPQNYFPDQPNNPQWTDLGEYYFQREPPFYCNEDNEVRTIGINSESYGGSAEDIQDSQGQGSPVPDSTQVITGSVWTLGDNRDPVLIQAIVDLSIWRLHNRISPMNIPDLRESNKNTVFQWLRDVRTGEQGISVPRIQPTQAGDMSCGYNVKLRNGF